MSSLQSIMDNLVNDPMSYSFLAIFLAMYGPHLHPKLPKMVRDLFNNKFFKFAVLVLIIYMSNRDIAAALIVSIGFLLVTNLSVSQETTEKFIEHYRENYSDFDTLSEFYESFETNETNENYENPSPDTVEYFNENDGPTPIETFKDEEEAPYPEESENFEAPYPEESENFEAPYPEEGIKENFESAKYIEARKNAEGFNSFERAMGEPHTKEDRTAKTTEGFSSLERAMGEPHTKEDRTAKTAEGFSGNRIEQLANYENYIKNTVENYKFKLN